MGNELIMISAKLFWSYHIIHCTHTIIPSSFPSEHWLIDHLCRGSDNMTLIMWGIIFSHWVNPSQVDCDDIVPLILTTPNPPKSSQWHFFWKNSALLETGTFTSSNGAKLLPGKKFRLQVLNMKNQRKYMVHFADNGMFPKVHWWILEDSGRFPNQNSWKY